MTGRLSWQWSPPSRVTVGPGLFADLFRCFLPTPRPVWTVPVRSGGPYSVLVAEDNRDAADSLAIFLRLRGYTVRVVHSGPAAVMAALAHPPDCAIIDIGLPGLDGCTVARE